jgi:hypothetical protein
VLPYGALDREHLVKHLPQLLIQLDMNVFILLLGNLLPIECQMEIYM